jgi:curli biogenesis system outer membrane secretion channel CsgG
MSRKLLVQAATAAALTLAAAAPAHAQFGAKANTKNTTTPELPTCAQPIGTVAIQEPERQWWTALGLNSPESLIKLMAGRSNCLRVVDRNGGLAMRNTEAALANSGGLQRGSNVGAGQIRAADYFIIPDIVNSNANSGGNAIGAVAGAFGRRFAGPLGGAIAGGLSTKSSEAQTILTLVNARTTEQEFVAEGAAKKTDISFGVGGGGFGPGGFGAAAGGGYANTDIGKVITAAYFNAFVNLVQHMQATAPGQAAAAAPTQAYSATQATVLRTTPSPTGGQVRAFKVGDLVYPTGQKNGVWWEADDENGNRGWVPSTMISPRQQ